MEFTALPRYDKGPPNHMRFTPVPLHENSLGVMPILFSIFLSDFLTM